MRSTKKLSLFIVATALALGGCKKEKAASEPEKPFEITEHFLAGTIAQPNKASTSVYLIKLLENNKAIQIGSGSSDFSGEYTLTKDSLIFIANIPGNYRELRCAISAKHEITGAKYKGSTSMDYHTTAALIKIEQQNQLMGKTFKGEEYRFGPVVDKPVWYYKFDATGNAYGSGIEVPTATPYTPEIINNSAFKFKASNYTEIGFVNVDSLTVYRSESLPRFGAYKKQ